MGLIKDIIFGRQINIHDSRIGELTTRVKNTHPSVNYIWTGSYKLSGQKKETIFLLNGNSAGPYREQLNSVYRIIDTLGSIITSLDLEISVRQNVNSKFKNEWTKDYYLASVSSYDHKDRDNNKKFEMSFEPLNENSEYFIDLFWENDKLTNIEIY